MSAISPSFKAFFLAAVFACSAFPGEASAAPDPAATRPSEQLLLRSMESEGFPQRYFYHLRVVSKTVRSGSDDVTGNIIDLNLYRNGEAFDCSARSFRVEKSTTRPNMVSRTIWNEKQLLHRQQAVEGGPELVTEDAKSPSGVSARGESHDAFLDGQIRFDEKRMAEILLESGTCELLGQEEVSGRACSVVGGKTPSGEYKLWLDPEVGCRVIKASVVKRPGDLLEGGRRMPSGSRLEIAIGNISLTKIGGRIIAISGAMTETAHRPDGTGGTTESTVVRSRFDSDPDFAKFSAFVMDGIPNGQPVEKQDRSANDHFAYIWKNGQVVRDTDAGVQKLIDSTIGKERNSAKSGN